MENSKVFMIPRLSLTFPRISLLDMFPRRDILVIMAAACSVRPAAIPQGVRKEFRYAHDTLVQYAPTAI